MEVETMSHAKERFLFDAADISLAAGPKNSFWALRKSMKTVWTYWSGATIDGSANYRLRCRVKRRECVRTGRQLSHPWRNGALERAPLDARWPAVTSVSNNAVESEGRARKQRGGGGGAGGGEVEDRTLEER